MSSENGGRPQNREERGIFAHDCLRYRGLLYQIAERVLAGPEGAEETVNRSLATATRRPDKMRKPTGEFRSWLLRIVIDEALQILRERKSMRTLMPEAELTVPLIC